MPDNTLFHASLDPAAPRIADKEVTHAGDLAKVQIIMLAEVLGTEGAYTLREMAALDTLLTAIRDRIPLKSASATPVQVTVTTAPTSLVALNTARLAVLLRNAGSVDVYLGKSGVTTGTGFLLRPGETFTDDRTTQQWYGIVASGTCVVCVAEA